jgi:hypothetical protein
MTQRRDFLRQASLLAAGSVAAGSAATGPLLAQGPAAAAQGSAAWDMSWTARVTGTHRMCFDAHAISDGVCLHQARSFLQGYKDIYNLADSEVTAVLVIRHAAVPMVFGDALWADGRLNDGDKLLDPATGEPARRNPFINIAPNSGHALTWADGALDTLIARGVIVLACDLATRNFAGRIAAWRQIPRQDALDLVYANMIPGIYRMPTGIFATSHAQSLGCGVLNAV